MSSRRSRSFVFALLCATFGLVLWSVAETSFAQPPRGGRPGSSSRPGGDRGGRPGSDRGERPRSDRGGRPGRGDWGQGGNGQWTPPQEGGQWGPPQGEDQQGGDQGEQNGEGQGDPQGDQGGEFQGEGQGIPQGDEGNGPQWGDGRGQGDGPREEPRVNLNDALAQTNGATPITLNQREFTASDGARLGGVYFKGKGDKDTPVVVLLRDLNGKRDDYLPLAQLLSQQGYGVLIPDYRGQNGPQNGPRDNNPPNDRRQGQGGPSSRDIQATINLDRQVWFNFLGYLNNKELCNIKKTIVVGSGFGAALAASWAKNDWNSKETISQNVCGVVLISPDADGVDGKYDALTSLEALHKRAKFPTLGFLVFVGKMKEGKFEDAQEIQKKVGGKVADEKTPMEDRPCPLVALQTELQGDELLGFESFGVPTTIVQFVALRMQKLPKKRAKWEELAEKKSRRQ